MRGPAVTFDNVRVRLGGQDILAGASFKIAKGEIHAIVGPNGGGKTTLIRALLGQLPYEGVITMEPPGPVVIGYAPQSIDLDRNMPVTTRDVMAMMNQRLPVFLGRARTSRAAQDAALERMGLSAKSKRMFGQLSGGERQRLLFAQALIPSPDLLIMDEPTSNMDEEGARLVERVVGELRAGGTTVIWINHDWDQVRRIADTVTGINRTVTLHGSPPDVIPPSGKAAAA
jgi:zinc transport system ATP-binding protein